MNKKLMAVAVAGAFGTIGAPAFAQYSTYDGISSSSTGSTVTISGRLNFVYGRFNSGSTGNNIGTAPGVIPPGPNTKLSYDSFNNSESEIDIKGQEDLGGGNAAWFQCGSTIDITGTAAAQGTGGICGRNSAIGMKGKWGNANGGNWDTPIKVAMTPFSVFPQSNPVGNALMFNSVASDAGNVAIPASTTASSVTTFNQAGGGASFWRRQSRLLTYITPNFKGFQASVAYSAANEASANSFGTGIQKPRLYSFGSNYTNGPLKLNVGYEIHKDYNPGALSVTTTGAGGAGAFTGNYSGGTDTGLFLGASYKFLNDSVIVNAQYVNMNWQIAGNLNTTQTNWGLNGAWNIAGPHTIKLGYVKMGSTGGTYGGGGPGGAVAGNFAPALVGTVTANGGAGNTGATKFQSEYTYSFSKRTDLSAMYGKVNNDSQANITIGTGSTTGNYGQSQSFYGMRLQHTF